MLDSAVILACVTAFLYSASTAFTHGFFQALDLDGEILDRNFHQVLYHGMILNIWSILYVPLVAAGLVTLYSLYKICLSEYVNKDTTSAKKIVYFKKRLKLPTKKKRPFVVKYERKYRNSWSILMGAIIFIVGMAHFEKKGVQEARQILQNIKTDKNSRVIVQINGTEKELSYLYCGSRNCAAFNKKTNEIVYFPQSGHSYVRQREI